MALSLVFSTVPLQAAAHMRNLLQWLRDEALALQVGFT